MKKFLIAVAAVAALIALTPRQASAQVVVQYAAPTYVAPAYSYGYSSYYSPAYSSYSYSQSYVPYSYGAYAPTQAYYPAVTSYYVSPSYSVGYPTYYGGQVWISPSYRRWR
jgi:hypothetical protein